MAIWNGINAKCLERMHMDKPISEYLHHILVQRIGWSSWSKELMLKMKDSKDTRQIDTLFLKL